MQWDVQLLGVQKNFLPGGGIELLAPLTLDATVVGHFRSTITGTWSWTTQWEQLDPSMPLPTDFRAWILGGLT